jgi:hypothetical protein
MARVEAIVRRMHVALESTDLTNLGIGVIVGLVVVGFLQSMIITALVARVVILALVVAAGVWVWHERTSIKDDIDRCHLSGSFFGVHVSAPADVARRCRELHR